MILSADSSLKMILQKNSGGKKEMEQRIKGTTGLMALIGSPVGHSGSPAMYNFSFRHHNLDYTACTSEPVAGKDYDYDCTQTAYYPQCGSYYGL